MEPIQNRYILGVFFAILAGIIIDLGIILQKKIINEHKHDDEFLKNLIRSRQWLLGITMQVAIGGGILYLIAILLIGPTLVPSLQAAGLIVLALGSVKILKESLKPIEVLGILLMILGIVLLSLSGIILDVSTYDILELGFIIRILLFTIVIISIIVILEILHRNIERLKGILLALESGFILSINTVWIGPATTGIAHFISGTLIIEELLIVIPSIVILGLGMFFGMMQSQRSLKYGQSNMLVPITAAPGQVIPIIAFFIVFALFNVTFASIIYVTLGISAIIISSFLLANRQVRLDEINK